MEQNLQDTRHAKPAVVLNDFMMEANGVYSMLYTRYYISYCIGIALFRLRIHLTVSL